MPHQDGYSIYVSFSDGYTPGDDKHAVRVYRDVDDQHIHSYEGTTNLHITLQDAASKIKTDMAARKGIKLRKVVDTPQA